MFQRGEKNWYDLSDFHYGVTDSVRRGGLIISQTADLLRFSHTTTWVSVLWTEMPYWWGQTSWSWQPLLTISVSRKHLRIHTYCTYNTRQVTYNHNWLHNTKVKKKKKTFKEIGKCSLKTGHLTTKVQTGCKPKFSG